MRRLSALIVLVILTLLLGAPRYIANATHPQRAPLSQGVTPGYPDEVIPPTLQQDDESSQPLIVESDDLEVTIPLGQQQTFAISITNSDSRSHEPALYRAQQGTPVGVPRRTIPDALRHIALPDQDERVDTQILHDLEDAPDGETEFLVFLDEQPDLSSAYNIADWEERGWFVYKTLSENAERSQRSLRDWLDDHGIAHEPLWIVNALVVQGTRDDVEALAQRHDVALLRANYTSSLSITEPVTPSLEMAMPTDDGTVQQLDDEEGAIPWNIQLVQADRVWYEFGISGEGIVVANNDNGASFTHPALIRQYRGYRGNDQFNHNYNWFDSNNLDPSTAAAGDHGTHTMGTMVARGNGTNEQPAYGVAPGATWMTARGCQTITCRDADLIAAAQWLLAPTDLEGNNPRPDLRPHIVNNSWAGSEQSNWYLSYITAWRAAGMFPVFVTGNSNGIACGSIVSPGDYGNVVGVGATDRNDEIASFSRVGPPINGNMKPDITAPGHSIRSTIASATNPYGVLQGTSMAAPHVAGTVALLWAANPDLIGDYDETYRILIESATPITDEQFNTPQYEDCPANEVPNYIYGYGRLDAYRAMTMAQVNAPWIVFPETIERIAPTASDTISITLDTRQITRPGNYRARVLIGTQSLSQTPESIDVTLTVPNDPSHITVNGRIMADRTNQPLSGAVQVSNGPRIQVDDDGLFEVVLPDDTDQYTFLASSPGYVTSSLTLPVAAGTTENVTIALMPDVPRAHLHTDTIDATLAEGEYANRVIVVENIGTQPLTYSMKVRNERMSIWRSDTNAGSMLTNWVAAPGTAIPLTLADDGVSERIPLDFNFPFYGKTYSSVFVYANGLLVLGEPQETEYFFEIPGNGCFPVRETDGAALVPLRTDLDPSQGGTVTYGYVPDGFVVTFTDVPLHDSPTDLYTFQVLLRSDGRILYNYLRLGTLSPFISVGLQASTSEVLSIGCGAKAPIANGLTLELRPQPNPPEWIRLLQGNSGIIEPGTEAHIPARLTWVVPNTIVDPYVGHVLLSTNDPDNPNSELRVTLRTTGSTPSNFDYSVWLPLVQGGE